MDELKKKIRAILVILKDMQERNVRSSKLSDSIKIMDSFPIQIGKYDTNDVVKKLDTLLEVDAVNQGDLEEIIALAEQLLDSSDYDFISSHCQEIMRVASKASFEELKKLLSNKMFAHVSGRDYSQFFDIRKNIDITNQIALLYQTFMKLAMDGHVISNREMNKLDENFQETMALISGYYLEQDGSLRGFGKDSQNSYAYCIGLQDKLIELVGELQKTIKTNRGTVSNTETSRDNDEREEPQIQPEEVRTEARTDEKPEGKPRTLQEILDYYKNNPPKTEEEAKFVLQKLKEISDAQVEMTEILEKMTMLFKARRIIEDAIQKGNAHTFRMVNIGGFTAHIMQRRDQDTNDRGIMYSCMASQADLEGGYEETAIVQDSEGNVYRVMKEEVEGLVKYLKEHGLSVYDPEKEAKKRTDQDQGIGTPFE